MTRRRFNFLVDLNDGLFGTGSEVKLDIGDPESSRGGRNVRYRPNEGSATKMSASSLIVV